MKSRHLYDSSLAGKHPPDKERALVYEQQLAVPRISWLTEGSALCTSQTQLQNAFPFSASLQLQGLERSHEGNYSSKGKAILSLIIMMHRPQMPALGISQTSQEKASECLSVAWAYPFIQAHSWWLGWGSMEQGISLGKRESLLLPLLTWTQKQPTYILP